MFAPYFSNRIWQRVQILLLAESLPPGWRTVTVVSVARHCLRPSRYRVGLCEERKFQRYDRMLNRAIGLSWVLSRTPLQLLMQTFVPNSPIMLVGDPVLKRRRGAKSKAKSI